MVRYFSDFLTEINTIIVNIKQCVYELVDVYLLSLRQKIIKKY